MAYKEISPKPVSEGGTGASTLTDHGVLLGSGTSAISATSAGTSGQVLTSNGAGSDPTFQDAGASGYLSLLDSQTFSSASEVVFTDVPNSGYRYFMLKGRFTCSTTSSLSMRTSNDNGSTYATSGYLPPISNQITLGNINSTNRHLLEYKISSQASNYFLVSGWTGRSGSGPSLTMAESANTGVNAFKVYPESGTITGNLTLWEFKIA